MENRIGHLSTLVSQSRQTPRAEFGSLLTDGLVETAGSVAGLAASIPGGPALSAAVSRVASAAFVNPTRSLQRPTEGAAAIAVGSEIPAGTRRAGSDTLADQRALMLENQSWTSQYLQLQDAMQRESREFTAVSNILKVRHESARTAINNLR